MLCNNLKCLQNKEVERKKNGINFVWLMKFRIILYTYFFKFLHIIHYFCTRDEFINETYFLEHILENKLKYLIFYGYIIFFRS